MSIKICRCGCFTIDRCSELKRRLKAEQKAKEKEEKDKLKVIAAIKSAVTSIQRARRYLDVMIYRRV